MVSETPPRALTRRQLAQTGAAALLALAADRVGVRASISLDEDRFTINLTAQQKARLLKALEEQDPRYDAKARLVERHLGGAYQYHTNLRNTIAHPTRESIGYAVALLDTGDAARETRAFDIIRRILDLQDKGPNGKWVGIWGWYAEEPPQKMSPADWNWADFIGVQLLQIVLSHRSRLPEDIATGIQEALKRATFSIRRRDVQPGYTNIAIMGTYVTLVAGETYGDADLTAYGLSRLHKFHEFSQYHGAFNEFNSPTYTIVALEEIARLKEHARSAEAMPLIDAIYRMAWEEIAHHFHAPTRQWAGPHSRAYSDLLPAGILAIIERNTSDRVQFGVAEDHPSATEHRFVAPCPADLEEFFISPAPRTLVKTFIKGDSPTFGTTCLTPKFALGSVNQGDLWNQRRPLIAYWGTAEKPACVRVRFLHDGYDLAAVRWWSTQRDGNVLAAIALATDGGDKHPSIDRIKDATLVAKDLRLRFEFSGAAGTAKLTAPPGLAQEAKAVFDDIHIGIAIPHARWGEACGTWEAGTAVKEDRNGAAKAAVFDVVYHSGEERSFKLNELAEAAAVIAFRIGTTDQPIGEVSVKHDKDLLRLEWEGLSLATPFKPDNGGALAGRFRRG